MFKWRETRLNLSIYEEHGILLSFLRRFNEKFHAVLCAEQNIRYFALEGDSIEVVLIGNPNVCTSLNPLDYATQQLLDTFESLHFVNQFYIIHKFYYYYTEAPYISYCHARQAISSKTNKYAVVCFTTRSEITQVNYRDNLRLLEQRHQVTSSQV